MEVLLFVYYIFSDILYLISFHSGSVAIWLLKLFPFSSYASLNSFLVSGTCQQSCEKHSEQTALADIIFVARAWMSMYV